jgi:methyl-accepting chemotaxis protein
MPFISPPIKRGQKQITHYRYLGYIAREKPMKFTLGKKLCFAFGVVLSFVVLSSVMGYVRARRIRLSEDVSFGVSVPSMKAAIRLQRDLNRTQVKGRQAILAASQPKRLAEARNLFQDTWQNVDEDMADMDKLAPNWSNPQNRERLKEIKKQLPILRGIQEDAINHAASGKKNAMAKAGNESADRATPVNIAMKDSLGTMVQSFEKLVDDNRDELRADNRALNITIILTALLALAAGVPVAIVLSRHVSRATRCVLAVAEAIATGDLTCNDLEVRGGDELGDLAAAINKMSANLKRMILAIAENSMQLASASEQLSSSATLQAQGAESQKNQTTHIAAAMQEMSVSLQQVAGNCARATEASRHAAETARQGGAVVEQALTQMRAIADSVAGTANQISELGKKSDQIGRVTAVIDDIADQTNLLALNAAIEAARAGEHGRGFAVVADEVRKLAERTTTATHEIAEMISTIQVGTKGAVKAMEAGSQQAQEGVISTTRAGESLQQIIRMSEEVGSMISQIDTSAAQQSQATAEVNQNMDRIAGLVRESAVASAESAKACQDLSELALTLQNMVGSFKLGTNDKPGAAKEKFDDTTARGGGWDGLNQTADKESFAATAG